MAGLGRRAPRAVGVGFFLSKEAPWGRALLYTLKGGGSLTPPLLPAGCSPSSSPACHQGGLIGKTWLEPGATGSRKPLRACCSLVCLEEVVVRFGWGHGKKESPRDSMTSQAQSERGKKLLLILRCDCVSLHFPAFSLVYNGM